MLNVSLLLSKYTFVMTMTIYDTCTTAPDSFSLYVVNVQSID